MTGPERVYAETLNLLGSDVIADEKLQDTIDQEHAAADPGFARALAKRQKLTQLLVVN